jgi:membrane fusion protein (multidrug efflux system)
VNSGLNAGERVIVEGVNKVRVGDVVRVVDVTTTLGKAQ